MTDRVCQRLLLHDSPRVRWISKRRQMVKTIIEVVLDQLPSPIPVDIEDIEVMAESVAFEAVLALRGKWLPGGVQLHPVSATRWQFTMEHAIRDVSDVVVAESVNNRQVMS